MGYEVVRQRGSHLRLEEFVEAPATKKPASSSVGPIVIGAASSEQLSMRLALARSKATT